MTTITPAELRTIMRKLGTTQAQLAVLIEVSQPTLSAWLSGKTRCAGPPAILLRLMAQAREDIRAEVKARLQEVTP